MRKTMMILMALVAGGSQAATMIDYTYTGNYSSHPEYIKQEVRKAKQVIGPYLEKELGCQKIEFCLVSVKDRILRMSEFNMRLKAECSETFTNFKFEYFPAFDFGELSDANVTYVKNSASEREAFRMTPMTYEDIAGINKKNYKDLPFCSK